MTESSLPRQPSGSAFRLVLLALILAAAVGGVALLLRAPALLPGKHSAPELANTTIGDSSLYQLDSQWTTEQGHKIRLSELRGKAQVMSMIFTSCPSACPTLVKEMQALERKLDASTRARTGFVLVSIDPDRDTPAVLRAYAEKMGLALDRWTLLRGSAEDVRELSATLGVSYGKGEGAEIAHSKLISVLNPGGEIVHQQLGVLNDPQRLVEAVSKALGAR